MDTNGQRDCKVVYRKIGIIRIDDKDNDGCEFDIETEMF